MIDSIAQLTGAPIERYELKWLLVFKDFGLLQRKIDMPKHFQVLVSLPDIMRWCQTPDGIMETLRIASVRGGRRATEQELEAIPVLKRIELVGELINSFLGVEDTETQTSGEDGGPLSVADETLVLNAPS